MADERKDEDRTQDEAEATRDEPEAQAPQAEQAEPRQADAGHAVAGTPPAAGEPAGRPAPGGPAGDEPMAEAPAPAGDDAPAVAEPPGETPDEAQGGLPTMGEVMAAADAPTPSPYNSALLELKPGDVVTGTVVQVNDNEVLVDVGYKSEGIIPISELSRRFVEKASDVVSVGDEILVTVLRVDEREEGRLILSKKRADEVGSWDRLQQAYENREVLEVPVLDAVKGGLIADVGVRGFIPASQVGQEFIRDLAPYVGKTLRVRIIEIDRADRRVILSEKVVLDEEQTQAREETWAKVQEGQVWTGVVKRITDFGAFVDIGGVDGLLHISEMAWGRIGHPSEILKEGQTIDVKILRVDRERQRISLGYKQLLPDPWANLAEKYPPGTMFTGKVVRLVNFGAFVELEPGVDGLIHISQLADRRVASPDEVVKVGDEVTVRVLAVNPRERRISLSLREAQDRLEEPAPREERGPRGRRGGAPGRRGDRDRGDRDRGGQYYPGEGLGTGTGGGITIGDLMGDVLKIARTDDEGPGPAAEAPEAGPAAEAATAEPDAPAVAPPAEPPAEEAAAPPKPTRRRTKKAAGKPEPVPAKDGADGPAGDGAAEDGAAGEAGATDDAKAEDERPQA